MPTKIVDGCIVREGEASSASGGGASGVAGRLPSSFNLFGRAVPTYGVALGGLAVFFLFRLKGLLLAGLCVLVYRGIRGSGGGGSSSLSSSNGTGGRRPASATNNIRTIGDLPPAAAGG